MNLAARNALRGLWGPWTQAQLNAYQDRVRGIERRWSDRIAPRLIPEHYRGIDGQARVRFAKVRPLTRAEVEYRCAELIARDIAALPITLHNRQEEPPERKAPWL
jgi:phage portal protein BeeE